MKASSCGLKKKCPSSGADLSPAPSLAEKGDIFSKGMNPLRAVSLCNSADDISGAVYNILIDAARQRHTITYKELAAAFGLDWGRSYGQCRRLYPVLKGICRAETAQGRPMLGAVVVRQNGTPGRGFFRGARNLGRLTGEDERSFWQKERDKVWEKWAGSKT